MGPRCSLKPITRKKYHVGQLKSNIDYLSMSICVYGSPSVNVLLFVPVTVYFTVNPCRWSLTEFSAGAGCRFSSWGAYDRESAHTEAGQIVPTFKYKFFLSNFRVLTLSFCGGQGHFFMVLFKILNKIWID